MTRLKSFVFLLLILAQCSGVAFAADRVALVIGNSKYEHLGTLPNTLNDAQSMSKSLKEMGYETTTLIDASDVAFRRELRNFSLKSSNASIAVVFYAGHGAQVNGENYLLPVDVEAPKRESDIRLSSIKVDDVINSIQAKTKVIFLDACRDNPALLKSLASGRGAYRGGLAPANGSSFELGGSGVFIAYATDAGSVALDSIGKENSPFTTALLTHMKKPMSIDDMFSMVTRDVRQATKNAQRPYKYASLDGVVCLSDACNSDKQQTVDQKPKAKLSWVLTNMSSNPREFAYIQPGSITTLGGRVIVNTKWEKELTIENQNDGKPLFRTQEYVTSCDQKKYSFTDLKSYDAKGVIKENIKFGSAEFMTLHTAIVSKSIAETFNRILCNGKNHHPLVPATDIGSPKWTHMYTSDIEKNTQYFYLKSSHQRLDTHTDITVKFFYGQPLDLAKFYPELGVSNTWPLIQTHVILNRFYCNERHFAVLRQNYFSAEGEWIADDLTYDETDARRSAMPEAGEFMNFFKFICALP